MSQVCNPKVREWASRVEEWKQSGKKVRDWCQEKQIVYSTFIAWRNRLKYNEPEEINQSSCAKAQFIELQDQPKILQEISLEYKGAMIHLKGGFDVGMLKQCFVILRETSC